MSYTDLCDNFESVSRHLKCGGQLTRILCSFFKSYRKLTDSYAQQILRITLAFAQEITKNKSMDTLSTGLKSLIDFFVQQSDSYQALCVGLDTDVVAPLEVHIEQFLESFQTITALGVMHKRSLAKAAESLAKCRKKYYQAAAAAGKLSGEKIGGAREKGTRNKSVPIGKALDSYHVSIAEANSKWDEYDSEMPLIMEKLELNEKNRIIFLKNSLENFTWNVKEFQQRMLESNSDFKGIIGNINANIDTRVFAEINTLTTIKLPREKYVSYEEWTKRNEQESQEDTESLIINEILDNLLSACRDLGSGIRDFSKLKKLLDTENGRTKFIDCLEKRRDNNALASDSMTQLAGIMRSMLTIMQKDNKFTPHIITKIIVLAHQFFTETIGKRQYLSTYLRSHKIWEDAKLWLDALELNIASKRETDRQCIKKLVSRKKKKEGLLWQLKTMVNKLPSVFAKDELAGRAEKSASYTVISQFVFHMIHMELPNEIAQQVVLIAAKRVELDEERTQNLLSDIEGHQRTALTEHSLLKQRQKLSQEDLTKWGELYPVYCSLKFLPLNDIRSLLLVCRAWNRHFTQVFLVRHVARMDARIRTHCWRGILDDGSLERTYHTSREGILSDSVSLGNFAGIIEMDVARSFQGQENVPKTVLSNILRTFAHKNPQIGYCQGMNYIAGTLYAQLRDEELAYYSMTRMIERYSMQGLYNNSLSRLKLYFYQLDRLIGIFLPQTNDSFKQAGISAGHFSASWFMTIFASILQQRPELLAQIWDLFFAKGWKIVFQASLVILSRLESSLNVCVFEGIMSSLSNLSAFPLQTNKIFSAGFIEELSSFRMSNVLLREIEDNYNSIKEKVLNNY